MPEGFNLILAGALLSISVNPLAFGLADRAIGFVRKRPGLYLRLEEQRQERIGALQRDLDAAREKAESRAAAHKTFTPEELASRFPVFAGLTHEQREVLLLHFHTTHVDPGMRVIRKGDDPDGVFFIMKGAVEVIVSGKKIKLAAGDVFGEMALISGQPRSADVITLDYCTFAKLSQRDFRQFLRKYPDVRDHISGLAAQREETNRRLAAEAAAADAQGA